jgi:uncharacterized membrane protein YeaQ/YmgE (transglycosylase-associated protein family)
MSVGACVIAGLIIGFIANKLVLRHDDGVVRDTFIGAIGAVAIGALFGAIGPAESGGPNVFGVITALAGAAGALVAYHMLFVGMRTR